MQAESRLLVMKFGGTSVGTVAAMAQAVQIIQKTRRDWPRMLVITSALSGVTDLLIQSALACRPRRQIRLLPGRPRVE